MTLPLLGGYLVSGPLKWILPTSPGQANLRRLAAMGLGQEVPPWRKLSITWKLKQTLWMRKLHSYDKRIYDEKTFC